MFIFFQKLIPKHCLSRLLGKFAHSRCTVFKNLVIRIFIRYFNVDMRDSLITDINKFPSFNDFFIRHLNPQARLIDINPDIIVSPVDGDVSEFGRIQGDCLLQAKNAYFSLTDLLGGNEDMAKEFIDGHFITLYLAPKDYHRVHMPMAGKLRKMIYVPGELFSVNPLSVKGIPGLFARNERVICYFDSASGPLCVIFVGALLVGSVVTVWDGQVMPAVKNSIHEKNYANDYLFLEKGAEIGYFQWGSTVIVLTPARVDWLPSCGHKKSLTMGEAIGLCKG